MALCRPCTPGDHRQRLGTEYEPTWVVSVEMLQVISLVSCRSAVSGSRSWRFIPPVLSGTYNCCSVVSPANDWMVTAVLAPSCSGFKHSSRWVSVDNCLSAARCAHPGTSSLSVSSCSAGQHLTTPATAPAGMRDADRTPSLGSTRPDEGADGKMGVCKRPISHTTPVNIQHPQLAAAGHQGLVCRRGRRPVAASPNEIKIIQVLQL